MGPSLLAALIVLAAVTGASGQTSRFEIGPIVRLGRIFIEGNGSGASAAAGAVRRYGCRSDTPLTPRSRRHRG